MRKLSLLVLLSVFVLTACQPAAPAADESMVQTAIVQTEAAKPVLLPTKPTATDPPPPTETAVPPTETPIPPTNTPLPENILFRDDFNGNILPDWEIANELPDRWSISEDGKLVIAATQFGLPYVHNDAGTGQNNQFLIAAPSGEFQITTRVNADTTRNFQQAALFIYQDDDNFIIINRGFCDICQTGGNGIYMDYEISGAVGTYMLATKEDEVSLRIVYREGRYEGYYSFDDLNWTRLGQVGGYVEPLKVGFGAANLQPGDNDLIAIFDYFEVSRP